MSYHNGPRVVTNGLVLYLDAGNNKSYPGSGSVWNDLSGNNNNGTLVNGVGYNSANRGSLIFDGTNDHVEVSHNAILNPSLNMTVSSWINIASFKFQMSIFGKGSTTSGSGGFDFRIDSSTQLNLVKYFIADQNITVPTLSTNIWYNMSAVQSSTRVDYYINGINVGFFSNSTAYQINTASLRVCRDRNVIYTSASISNISLYNRALSPSEVRENYNATKGRFSL